MLPGRESTTEIPVGVASTSPNVAPSRALGVRRGASQRTAILMSMDQRKMFWLVAAAMSTVAGFVLPILWSLAALPPILVISWWVVYRSDWF